MFDLGAPFNSLLRCVCPLTVLALALVCITNAALADSGGTRDPLEVLLPKSNGKLPSSPLQLSQKAGNQPQDRAAGEGNNLDQLPADNVEATECYEATPQATCSCTKYRRGRKGQWIPAGCDTTEVMCLDGGQLCPMQ